MQAVNRLTERFLEQPWVYRAWQSPFADQKFAPVLAHNDFKAVKKVLDIGCGPGTNTKYFANAEYLGVDINEQYVQHARRRHSRAFIASDVRTYSPEDEARFDFVLINSFLHHLNSGDVAGILSHVPSLLDKRGHVHILEVVMPPEPSISRLLARWDRGKFVRPVEEWNAIFSKYFEPVLFERYPLTGSGVTLWNMVYFKGRPRR